MQSETSIETDATDDATPIPSRLAGHPRLHKLAIKFVEQWPQKLSEMRSAQAAGDLAELARLAHGIKGIGSSVGYDALFEPSKALDVAAKAGDAATAARCLDRLAGLGRRLQPPAPIAPAAPAAAPLGAQR